LGDVLLNPVEGADDEFSQNELLQHPYPSESMRGSIENEGHPSQRFQVTHDLTHDSMNEGRSALK
jgi:hypothetical protein